MPQRVQNTLVEFCTGYSDDIWEAAIAVAVWDSLITGGALEGTTVASTNGCSLTFTAPATESYIVVISSVGNCGRPADQRNNGFLTLTCGPNGAVCPGDEVDCSVSGPALSIVGLEDVDCNGTSTGSISVFVEEGTGVGEIDFTWFGGDSDSSTLSGIPAGTYTVIATDENGCIDSMTIDVSEPDAINIVVDSVINPTIGFDDGAAYVSISGGSGDYTIEWSNGSTDEDLIDAESGIYTITVTDENDCMATLNVSVLDGSCETTDLAFTYSTTPEDCNMNNGSVTIEATGGTPPYTYDWPIVISTSNDAMITGVSEGVFIFSLIDNNGCIVQDTIIVDGNRPFINVVSAEGVSCVGIDDGSIDIDVTAGVPPYSYLWSTENRDTTQDVSGLKAGLYAVTVTDAVGCDFTRSVVIEGANGIEISIDSLVSATTGNADGAAYISVTGGSPDYSYAWDGQAGDQDLQNATGGSHTVLVVDANECEAELEITIPEMIVGVDLLESVSALNIYPNPTRDKVNIYLELDQLREVAIDLMAYDGRILEQISVEEISSKTYSFDLLRYTTGIYFINVMIDEQHVTRRVSFIR